MCPRCLPACRTVLRRIWSILCPNTVQSSIRALNLTFGQSWPKDALPEDLADRKPAALLARVPETVYNTLGRAYPGGPGSIVTRASQPGLDGFLSGPPSLVGPFGMPGRLSGRLSGMPGRLSGRQNRLLGGMPRWQNRLLGGISSLVHGPYPAPPPSLVTVWPMASLLEGTLAAVGPPSSGPSQQGPGHSRVLPVHPWVHSWAMYAGRYVPFVGRPVRARACISTTLDTSMHGGVSRFALLTGCP